MVRTHGVIAPLLNLGAGFDYEATGKENVYLNGAILGYSKRELERKYEEIVEFSELGHQMHIPLKNYSSGMVARLGFAIAIAVESSILLVDEILSVGDENFRRKCARKIDELRQKGVSFVIVSHNMDQVKKLCQKALWIENAHVRGYGEVNEICAQYEAYCAEIKKAQAEEEKRKAEEAKRLAEEAEAKEKELEAEKKEPLAEEANDQPADSSAKVTEEASLQESSQDAPAKADSDNKAEA